ncbi:MAG TPA: Stf0 family sulfotransferase [Gammaproteobacteria bacterium]|nr:Stf0 family sulfotransferase [Gammaproteobacteria bacterium]
MHTSNSDPDTPRPVKSILIASETRSGSNFLCAVMTETNQLGKPREYFSKYIPFDNAKTVQERYRYACNNGITANGIISIKLFPEHWEMIEHQFDIDKNFPDRCWIWLRRKDLLAQAISRHIALNTRSWVSDTEPQNPPEYSARGIHRRLRYLANSEARWRIFFTRNGISPLELWYEDIIRDPLKTIADIASLAGIEIDRSIIKTDVYTKPQRTSLNEEWKQRYLQEMADINHMDTVWANRSHSFSLKNLWSLCRGKLPKP